MDLPCRMSIPAAQTLATHGKVSGIIWMKDQRQSRHSGRLHTVRGIGKPVGSAPIFRHTEESRPVLLNAGHIVELSRFRRFGKSPFIDRFMRQRFTRREAIHILDKLLDSLSRPLDHFIERAGSRRLNGRHLFVDIGRKPIRRQRQRKGRLCRWRRLRRRGSRLLAR